FSSRRRHTRFSRDWSSDVCSSDLRAGGLNTAPCAPRPTMEGMKTRTLPVALVQERNHGDADANLAIIEQRVAEAAKAGARLVLLQELHNSCYFCQHESVDEFDLAEPIPGPSTERL